MARLCDITPPRPSQITLLHLPRQRLYAQVIAGLQDVAHGAISEQADCLHSFDFLNPLVMKSLLTLLALSLVSFASNAQAPYIPPDPYGDVQKN